MVEFFEDVAQGGGRLDAWCDGKCQSFCLPWAVVRVLPEDDDFNVMQWGERQRTQGVWWVNCRAQGQAFG